MAFSLAKEGLFSSVNEVYRTRIDLVIDAYHYLNFCSNYQTTSILMNREK